MTAGKYLSSRAKAISILPRKAISILPRKAGVDYPLFEWVFLENPLKKQGFSLKNRSVGRSQTFMRSPRRMTARKAGAALVDFPIPGGEVSFRAL